jgi:SAM-dependent methyltransferase
MKTTCASCANSSRTPDRPHPAAPKDDAAAQYDAIAELYDGYPGNYLEDVLFYAEEAKRAGSPILEIGVGTGRLAFCLASVGLDVVGIDSSPAMLRLLETKRKTVGGQPGRVKALAADMRSFSLGRRFPLAICAFRTFLYLLTRADQRRALRAIRRHLAPGGRLVMSFFVPPEQLLAQGGAGPGEMARFPAPDGAGEVVAYDRAVVVPARQRLTSHITYEWRDVADRPLHRFEHSMVMRYLFPREVPPLLESCGYRVLHAYGGFDRRPLGAHSHEQIWVAEPAPPATTERKRESR